MKNIKWLFMAAVLVAGASAFATTKSVAKNLNLYVADYTSGSNFVWVLEETPTGICEEFETGHVCKVFAAEKPADNSIPPGAEMGDYVE